MFVPGTNSKFLCRSVGSEEINLEGKDFAFIGCGAGPEILVAAEKDPRSIVVSDIHPGSVSCTRENFERYFSNSNISAQFVLSDKLAGFPPRQQYDFIFCNPPGVDLESQDDVQRRIAFQGSSFMCELLQEIHSLNALKARGLCIFVVSNTSNVRQIFEQAYQCDFVPYILASEGSPPPYHETQTFVVAVMRNDHPSIS